MKLQKIISTATCAIILVFSSITSVAQNSMSASQILDKVVSKLRNTPSLNMKVSIQNGKETLNANLIMAKDKFKFLTSEICVYYDGRTQWTVDNSAREVSLTVPTVDELAETNPLAFVNNYRKAYTVKVANSTPSSYTIIMTANKKSFYVRSASVTISSSTWLPTAITAKLSNGQTMTVKVQSATTGNNLPIGEFRYNTKTNPKYDIIDLR